jgi:hypothetical protein
MGSLSYQFNALNRSEKTPGNRGFVFLGPVNFAFLGLGRSQARTVIAANPCHALVEFNAERMMRRALFSAAEGEFNALNQPPKNHKGGHMRDPPK